MTTNRTIQCPNCGQPIHAAVENLIDVSINPEAKTELLTGRINSVQCPNCGVVSTIAAPLLYHDAEKELLISFVPMELGLPKQQQEKAMGDLMRQLTSQLPQGGMKGYMFRPREALTMQGLVDQVLQADGVTPEMMEAQRARIRLVETLLQTPPDQLPEVIKQHDSEIDSQLFQAIMVMAQRTMQENRPDIAERLIMLQNEVMEHSTVGQEMLAQGDIQEAVVREVVADIEGLGQGAEISDLIELAIGYAGDDQRLQALVGLVRPALDDTFFQEMTARIGQAPADEREALEKLRERLTELTMLVDQQQQMAVQGAVRLLQAIANAPDPNEVIVANLQAVDDTFMAVLNANIQEAERRNDINSSARLKQIYQQVVSVLQQNMQPELRFVNDLLSTENDEDARKLLSEHAADFGEELLDVMDAVGQMLAQNGDQQMIEKLSFLKQAALQEFS